MRIGIFLDEWRDGGVPVFLERLERFLTGEGQEVFLFLANPHPKREKVPRELYELMKTRMGPRCVSLDLNSFPPAWRRTHFERTLSQHRIACLLINQFGNYISLLEAVASKIPLVSVAHTDLDYYYLEYLRTMELTQAHICVSKRIMEKTLSLTGPEQAGRIRHIPYGVEDSPTRTDTLNSRPLQVIYSARLDPIQKRCQDLVPIWKDYRERGGTGELTILGTGKKMAFLRSSFEEEIAAGTVRMLGHLAGTEALSEMARGDVILNLSNFEGLPQVVLEGVCLGLYPLLSAIESGHGEIVEKVGTGTICHVGDTQAFASELLRLEAELTALRNARGRIREIALEAYSLRKCCLSYLSVFQEVGRSVPALSDVSRDRRTAGEWIQRGFLLFNYRRHFRNGQK